MPDKEQYAKLVCLFLAEQLRIKKISLMRAAEIAQKVLNNLNLIDSERDLLKLIKELSKDFEELFVLEERVFFWMEASQRRALESQVKTFVIQIIPTDPNLALTILNEAIKQDANLENLKQKFPQFNEFLTKRP